MDENLTNAISNRINSYKDEMVKTMSEMVAIKAISPFSGGSGEGARADYLEKVINSFGVKTKRFDYKDQTGTTRSNITAVYGNKKTTLWIMPHMDTVSEGDLNLWKYDPFKAQVDGDKIYGRGTNDDGQDVISAIYSLKAAKEMGMDLAFNIALAIVADEEVGSTYGVQKLLEENIFKEGDMFIVPDSGNNTGSEVEIGEKGLMWLKITTEGKQVHASLPDDGVNAKLYASRFLCEAYDFLHAKYTKSNDVFRPSASTFEPTKQEKNVDSINIIPGKDVSYMDCRVLPEYKLDDILNDLKALAKKGAYAKARISIEPFERNDPAPISDKDSPLSKRLVTSLKAHGLEPYFTGIGGGTCAAFLRKKGFQCVVWSRKEDVEHQPNEYVKISDMLFDAKIFLEMYANQ